MLWAEWRGLFRRRSWRELCRLLLLMMMLLLLLAGCSSGGERGQSGCCSIWINWCLVRMLVHRLLLLLLMLLLLLIECCCKVVEIVVLLQLLLLLLVNLMMMLMQCWIECTEWLIGLHEGEKVCARCGRVEAIVVAVVVHVGVGHEGGRCKWRRFQHVLVELLLLLLLWLHDVNSTYLACSDLIGCSGSDGSRYNCEWVQ